MIKTKTKYPSASGTTNLTRARFGPGMLLQHEDLELLNTYPRDVIRLLVRNLFGCGVVCGLKVGATPWCGKLRIDVACGLALDCQGDPIWLPEGDKVMVGDDCDQVEGPYWIVLCGTTKSCGARDSYCGPDDDDPSSSYTRERIGYEIRAVAGDRPPDACGCPESKDAGTALPADDSKCQCVKPGSPGYEKHYSGECSCECGDPSKCDCKCVLLAVVKATGKLEAPWQVDHRVRRFVRPVLIGDQAGVVETPAKGAPGKNGKDPATEPKPTDAEMQAEFAALKAENQRLKADAATRIAGAEGTSAPKGDAAPAAAREVAPPPTDGTTAATAGEGTPTPPGETTPKKPKKP